MERGKRIRSALGWGFFYGICSWVLASGVTNKIPAAGVWGIVLAQTALGLAIGLIRWNLPWWATGCILGAAVNLPVGILLSRGPFVWGRGLFWPFILSGILFGFLIALGIRHSSKPPS
jgi:hypothetical protein